jgi:hypothetical protein
MNVNEVFPSNYLKAADLQGREIPVMIDRVEMESFGQDQKAIVYFRNKQKGVVLNKTNAMNIAGAYGDDTDGWVNQPVVLFSVWTDFQGKSVQAIRIRPGTMAQAPSPRQHPQTTPPPVDDMGDQSVPF